MTLSARETVFKIRQAEFQVQQLKKEISTAFQNPRTVGTSNTHEDRNRRDYFLEMSSRGNNRISFGGPSRGPPSRKVEFMTRDDLASISSIAVGLGMKKKVSTNLNPNPRHSHLLLLPGFRDLPKSPYVQEVLRQTHGTPGRQNQQPKTKANYKVTKTVFKSHDPQPPPAVLSSTKNNGDILKPKNVPSISQSVKEQPQGRMFRHRYKFQESVEPTPLVSRTPSAFLDTASGMQTPKAGAGAKTPILGSCMSSREQLCLPSPFTPMQRVKGPLSWMNKKFPRIGTELLTWKDHNRLMKPMKEVMYPGRAVRSVLANRDRPRTPSPEFSKQQPLPHKRGLIGIEISGFDAECSVFYRDRNGTYNPHLLPKFGERTAKKEAEKTPEVIDDSEEV